MYLNLPIESLFKNQTTPLRSTLTLPLDMAQQSVTARFTLYNNHHHLYLKLIIMFV